MNSILALNSDVLNYVVAEWINVPNLAGLDTAICSTIYRPQFLHIIFQSSCIRRESAFVSGNNISYLHWLALRRLKILHLSIEVNGENGENGSYSNIVKQVMTNLNEITHLRANRFSHLRDCIELLSGKIEMITFSIGYDDMQDLEFCDESLASILPSLHSLKELHLSNVTHIKDETCMLFAKYLPNLESFSSRFCEPISGDAVVEISKGCKHLKRLVFPEDVSDEQFLEVIGNCPLLTHIEISNCENLNDSSLLKLPEFCPHLISFIAETRFQTQDSTLVTLVKQYPALRVFNVNDCHNASDTLLMALAESCPDLEVLDVMNSDHVTDRGVMAVATHCLGLKDVNFGNNGRLTDMSVITLAEHCALLERVDVSESTKITDYSLYLLMDLCPALTQLCQYNTNSCGVPVRFSLDCNQILFHEASGGELVRDGLIRSVKAAGKVEFASYYCHITPEVRETIVFANRSIITRLHLVCEDSDLTDDSLCRMVALCPLLEDFKMTGCPLITAAVVDTLSLHCPRVHSVEFVALSLTDKHVLMLLTQKTHFKKLSVAQCVLLSDAVFMQLSTYCPLIEVLNISECGVTHEAIEHIVSDCGKLHLITLFQPQVSDRIEQICIQKGINLHTIHPPKDEEGEGEDEEDLFNHIELLEEGAEGGDSDDDDESDDDGFGEFAGDSDSSEEEEEEEGGNDEDEDEDEGEDENDDENN